MKLTLTNIKKMKTNSTPLQKRVINYIVDEWSNYDDIHLILLLFSLYIFYLLLKRDGCLARRDFAYFFADKELVLRGKSERFVLDRYKEIRFISVGIGVD